jgi:hypothetical protein
MKIKNPDRARDRALGMDRPQVLWAFVPVSNESIAAHEQLVE